jgi:hypothetical protein
MKIYLIQDGGEWGQKDENHQQIKTSHTELLDNIYRAFAAGFLPHETQRTTLVDF